MTVLPAISVRQPWAWAILHAGKDVENRTWAIPEKYIGRPVLLHASKGRDMAGDIYLRKTLGLDLPHALQRGGIVGMVQFGEVVESSPSPWADLGMKHWIITAVRPVMFYECPGQLKFFPVNYPYSLDSALRAMGGAR